MPEYLPRFPDKREDLFKYDVIILGDVPADAFSREQLKLLEEFVSSHHGGLCYVVSRKNTDDTLAAPNSPFEPLVNLLPVTLDREAINIADKVNEVDPSAWPVLPTVVGLEHPVLRLAADLKDNLSVWDILPGIYWSHPVARVKPLGSVLAVSKDTIRRTTDSSGEMAPLIAVQYYGKGRVMYMGIDETWRWRAVDEGSYYRKFWTNMVDFLASGRLQNKRIIITTGSETFAVGEEMRVHVEAYDRDFRPLEDDTFQVEMVDRATGHITRLRLANFDPFYSQAAWFRDYAAYCGLSDNGAKIYGVVMQLGRSKPVLRQELGAASQGDEPDADCAAPAWEKNPVRVTFLPKRGQKAGFAVRGHAADPAPGSQDEE